MSVQIIDTLEPKNNGSFPIAQAKDIEMPDGTRLSDYKFEADDNVEVDLLPLQQVEGFASNPTYGAYTSFIDPVAFSLTVGKTYTVVWDGESHTCIGQDMSVVVEGAVGLGNLAGNGGVGNNENFALALALGRILFLSTENKDSHDVRIYQTVSAPKLPAVTAADDGKFLRVVDGAWSAVALLDVSEVGL